MKSQCMKISYEEQILKFERSRPTWEKLVKRRWVLAAAIFIGWAAGLPTEGSEALIRISFTFFAGGIVLNELKENSPKKGKAGSRHFNSGLLLTAYCYHCCRYGHETLKDKTLE